jgi:hypothetical protein
MATTLHQTQLNLLIFFVTQGWLAQVLFFRSQTRPPRRQFHLGEFRDQRHQLRVLTFRRAASQGMQHAHC